MGYVLRRVALKLYNYYAKVFAVNYLSTTLEGAHLSYVLTVTRAHSEITCTSGDT